MVIGSGKSGKSAAKQKDLCFVQGCPEAKKVGKKCCAKHNKDLEAARYQAEKSKEGKYLKEIEQDPEKLSVFLMEFDQNNASGRFRKSLIDFAQFKKRFSVTANKVEQEREEEFTWTEFRDEKIAKGF